MAMQWATRANEAYRTLRDPIDRARYLLGLKGFDTGEETNTAMPADFLMQQMEWREGVAEARATRDADALAACARTSRSRAREMLELLARALDAANYEAGCSLVRKLRFLEKLDEEIDDALEPWRHGAAADLRARRIARPAPAAASRWASTSGPPTRWWRHRESGAAEVIADEAGPRAAALDRALLRWRPRGRRLRARATPRPTIRPTPSSR